MEEKQPATNNKHKQPVTKQPALRHEEENPSAYSRIEEELRTREEFLNTVIENSPDPLWVSDANGAVIRINQALRTLLKVTDEEIIGKYNVLKDVQVAEQGYLPLVQSVFTEGKAVNFTLNYRPSREKQTQAASDSNLIIEIVISPIKDAQGRVIHAICQQKSITRRVQAEKALQESQKMFYGAFHYSPGMNAIIHRGTGKVVEVNDALCFVTGYSREEVFEKPVLETNIWFNIEQRDTVLGELYQRGAVSNIELKLRMKNGEIRFFDANLSMLSLKDEPYVFVSMIDVTTRKQFEAALQASEQRFRTALDNMMEGCQIIDREWRYAYLNDASARLAYVKKEDLLGRKITDVFPTITKTEMYSAFIKCMEQHVPVRFEYEGVFKDGRRNWLDLSIHPVTEGIFVLSLDITARKQAEERIRHLNLSLRSIRNINQLITREKNRDRLIQEVCQTLVVGRSFHSAWIVLFDENLQPVTWAGTNIIRGMDGIIERIRNGDMPRCVQKALAQSGVIVTRDPSEQCPDCPIMSGTGGIGSLTIRLEFEGTLYGILCGSVANNMLIDEEEISLFAEVGADITFALRDIALSSTHELLQQEQLRAAKMESIGTLAGGIAHDFNNLLTGIIGNIGMSKTMVPADSDVYKWLDEAEKAATRSRDLTQQLLTFARGGKPIKKITGVSGVIKDAATFALRGSRVKLEMELPENLWLVEADEGQISQVIHNLVINADEAMAKGGTLRITARNLAIRRPGLLPLTLKNYVQIDVADTGTGISPENLQKIFEPYFTTKKQGSGLGLTSAYSIIKSHGGSLLAESRLNQGSIFHIYLPAIRKTSKGEKKVAEKKPEQTSGKVLVLDDDEVIRKMLKNMLNLSGYQSELTADGAQTLEKYKQAMQAGAPFDVVIMDLTVPGGMGGKEAIGKLLEIDPKAAVIVSSGYATDPIMSEYKNYGFSAVIAKPYSIQQLEDTIAGLIKKK